MKNTWLLPRCLECSLQVGWRLTYWGFFAPKYDNPTMCIVQLEILYAINCGSLA